MNIGRQKLGLAALLAVLAVNAFAQGGDFSAAHRKMARHFLSAGPILAKEAFWLRHDVLVLAVDKKTDAKDYAKRACERLTQYGFATLHPTVMVTPVAALRQNALEPLLAKRQCNK